VSKLSKDKLDRLFLVVAITAMIIASLWFLVIGGQRDSIEAIDRKSQQISDSIRKAELTVRGATNVQNNLNERLEVLRLRESEMAPEDDPYAWMLEIMTRSCQNTMPIWQLDKPEFRQAELLPGSSYRFAVFHFKSSGFYTVIGKFIADFENAHRMFQIRGVVITPAGGSPMNRGAAVAGDEETLSVEFYIVTPVRPTDSHSAIP
jgi:Tfp pilus assembly protein PilO